MFYIVKTKDGEFHLYNCDKLKYKGKSRGLSDVDMKMARNKIEQAHFLMSTFLL